MNAIKVFDLAFPPTRMPRSRAYKAGVLDTLLKQLDGVPDLPMPYQLGSAECDAYLAGEAEGGKLAAELMGWRHQPRSETPSMLSGHVCA